MSLLPADTAPLSSMRPWRELWAGMAGLFISLAPVLTMGLLAFAALGPQAAALGIPASFVATVVGGTVFALLSRGPMPAAGPSAAPVLALGTVVARVAADPAFAVGDPTSVAGLLALVAVAVIVMGLCQIVLGLSGLVRLAKFVPQPVLAGFMNGVALLALLALLPLMFGWPVGALQHLGWAAMPAVQPATMAVGVFTIAVMLGLPRLNRRLPATLIGLLAGSGAYALLHTAAPQWTLGPLTGELPMAWPQLDTLAPFLDRVDDPLLQRHLAAAVFAGVVMALIGTLELVLNGLAMDQARHTRTDPRREVLALGAANMASGVVGGLPLLLLRPRALHMIDMGGRSRAGLFICSVLFALVGLVGMKLLALLPQVVLAGAMVIVYLISIDRWSLGLAAQWWRGQREADVQLALLVVLLVCAVTLVLGFPAAVAAGAMLSMMLFIRSMNRSLVRTRYTGNALPSRRIYAAADEARLGTLRARATVLELEGALFFGSADRIAELSDELDADCHALVLDFRRVSLIDASGAVVLQQLGERLAKRGMLLLLAGVSADNRHGRVLAQFVGERLAAGHGMPDIDQAMERAELALLAQTGHAPLREVVPIEQVSLMDGLDPAQRTRLAAYLQPRRLVAGECLFRQGDPGDRLYVITSGSIDVLSALVPGSTALRQRYVSLSPGMMLGETAMLDGGGRSGEAVAVGDSEVHSLDDQTLLHLRDQDPLLYAQVYRNVALHLSQRLRAAALAWRTSTR
ncbi:MAG: cyclic nucleotide-binding domain-containing protein [Rubrivivax sp.]|jgi:SulP family sulfate permease|nr:cyclic nucleotide-binding domain-containing protein [Rubrivivax sp.]